ncbi:MAG: response regulator [Desulfosalsimonadaceae bacterium]
MKKTADNTLLLVDDEADVRDIMRLSAEDLGYEVICAKDGEEAVALFEKHQPPIVLTDIKMPRMDGIELLEKIKQIDPETEVIMITGHGDMNFAVKSFRFDATDFITKPISMESLERALKRASDKITIRRQFYEYTQHLEAMLSEKKQQLHEDTGPRHEGLDGGETTASTMRQVLEHLPCYISLCDKDLTIIEANAYFIENFGDAAGRHCYYLCKRRDEPCPECPVKKTFERGKSCQHETEYLTKDERTRKVLVWTLPVFESGGAAVRQVMSIATDLEEISEMQDNLSSLGLMIGSLSHGIKGLLTGLDSGVYLVNSGMAKENEERTREGLKIIQETTERLKKVVLDILFYAKEREFKKETLAVKDFAADLSQVVESRIESYGIAYRKEFEADMGEFNIDANCMIQALINVFENAIKACTEDEKKSKEHEIVLAVRPENGQVCFAITDNGIGMDAETRKSMFELFYSTRGSKGTGLGLFITRKIIEDHGGEIHVDSQPGEGTTVTVCIPRQTE